MSLDERWEQAADEAEGAPASKKGLVRRVLTTPGHPALYFLSAGFWTAIAVAYSSLLPVFPVFIAVMVLGVYLLPAWLKDRL